MQADNQIDYKHKLCRQDLAAKKLHTTIGLPLTTQKTAVSMSAFLSNGKEYCFLKGSTLPIICVGDELGIKYEKKLDMKMVDYGINDDFVICSLGIEEGDQEKLALLSINLKNGDVIKIDAEEQYYRIQGSGNGFLCVNWQFAPYQIGIDKKGTPAVTKLEYPGDVDLPNSNVFFSPLGDQKYMMIYNRNTNDSDSLELRQYLGHKKLNFSPSIAYAERIISYAARASSSTCCGVL